MTDIRSVEDIARERARLEREGAQHFEGMRGQVQAIAQPWVKAVERVRRLRAIVGMLLPGLQMSAMLVSLLRRLLSDKKKV